MCPFWLLLFALLTLRAATNNHGSEFCVQLLERAIANATERTNVIRGLKQRYDNAFYSINFDKLFSSLLIELTFFYRRDDLIRNFLF